MSRSIALLSMLVAFSGFSFVEPAGARCFPEVDGDLLVYFEQGDLNYPVVVGALWNDRDEPPASRDEVSLLAPHVLAAALLAEVASPPEPGDGLPGSISRALLEDLSGELARTYEALQRVYESGFVSTAKGTEDTGSLGFVAAQVDGVFQATVDASIEQMESYADLLAGVTKGVEEFQASSKGGDPSRERLLLDAAAAMIDLDLSLRDPDCD